MIKVIEVEEVLYSINIEALNKQGAKIIDIYHFKEDVQSRIGTGRFVKVSKVKITYEARNINPARL